MITSIVLVHDDAKILKKCLQSIMWSDEIIVVDDYSIDSSYKIANKFKAKVYKHHLHNNFAKQRNFALSKAKSEWVLFVDSDEIVSFDLAREIKRAIKVKSLNGYKIHRVDNWLGKELKHGEFGSIYLLRLARKNKGKWRRAVHESWNISGQVGVLKNSLQHFPHPSVASFISNINQYASMHAKENIKEGKKVRFTNIVFFPLAKFFTSYIIKQGFRDGVHGFVGAMIMSFHSFLAWSQAYFQKNYI